MNNVSKLAIVTALAFAGCAVAQADDSGATRSAVVRYADLDLNNAHGAGVLYQRIRTAAHSVCRELDSRMLALQQRYSACVQGAIAQALTDVDRTSVTAYAASGQR
jgi:UrcA family protein